MEGPLAANGFKERTFCGDAARNQGWEGAAECNGDNEDGHWYLEGTRGLSHEHVSVLPTTSTSILAGYCFMEESIGKVSTEQSITGGRSPE